jgi:NAD(P)-dependent dehydrogenase (short-subunit alcohol dehydrogenase family)
LVVESAMSTFDQECRCARGKHNCCSAPRPSTGAPLGVNVIGPVLYARNRHRSPLTSGREYATSRLALDSGAMSLVLAFAPDLIRVHNIAPGTVT